MYFVTFCLCLSCNRKAEYHSKESDGVYVSAMEDHCNVWCQQHFWWPQHIWWAHCIWWPSTASEYMYLQKTKLEAGFVFEKAANRQTHDAFNIKTIYNIITVTVCRKKTKDRYQVAISSMGDRATWGVRHAFRECTSKAGASFLHLNSVVHWHNIVLNNDWTVHEWWLRERWIIAQISKSRSTLALWQNAGRTRWTIRGNLRPGRSISTLKVCTKYFQKNYIFVDDGLKARQGRVKWRPGLITKTADGLLKTT